MDVLKGMNAAINYIEQHLESDINYQEVAKLTYFSEHHFKRLFAFIAGMSLSEYVRRRRLTLAAFDLKDSKKKVVDVALKYGYQSPDAFSRAFQAIHGVKPSEVKQTTVPLKAYPRMTFHLSIKGDVEMNYQLIEKEAFSVVGKKETVESSGYDFNPKMWAHMEEIEQAITPYENTACSGILHVVQTKENDTIDYYVSVATTTEVPIDFDTLRIPAHTWAVFKATCDMPESLLATWERVYTEWFPTSGYESADAPEIVKGLDDKTTEIWIPVKKITSYEN